MLGGRTGRGGECEPGVPPTRGYKKAQGSVRTEVLTVEKSQH